MGKIISIIGVYILVVAIIGWSVYNLVKYFKKRNRKNNTNEGECSGCCDNCNLSCEKNSPKK